MNVMNAVIAAEGDPRKMTTQNEETTTNTDTAAPGTAKGAAATREKATSKKPATPKKGAPKGQKSASVGRPRARAATKAEKPTKKAAKTSKVAEPKAEGVREGSKTETILALLQRPKGATLAELMEATSWQAHSVRGFISGTLGKKMGLIVKSEKRDDGTRVYQIAK